MSLQVFWETIGLSEDDVKDIVDLFADKSLAYRGADQELLYLHDLQWDYVRGKCGIVSVFRDRTSRAFPRLNEYECKHIAHHLIAAGQYEKLAKLLPAMGHRPN